MTRRYTGGFLSTTEQATDASTANGIFTLSETQQLTASGNFPTGRWTPQRSLRTRAAASAYLSRAMSLSSPPASVGGSLSNVYNFTISADTNSYSLQAEALKAGWDGKAAATFNLTISAGVVVGSGSSYSPALDLTGFPTGVAINVTVGAGAYVVGAGGKGGGGTGWPSNGGAGSDGGDAIWASVPVTITNNGTIAGGGGGGGGSEGWAPNGAYGIAGGGGGGGAGRIVGTGGAGTSTSAGGSASGAGSSGTLTTGGAGGAGGYHSGYTAGAGGAGGNLGAAGSAGAGSAGNWNGSNYAPGAGGAAGYYARGNTHITWSTAGTRLGQVQTAVPTTISMTTFTYSTWVKRGSMALADDQWLYGSGNFLTATTTAPIFELQFKGASSGVADRLNVAIENNTGGLGILQTNAVYRDPAAWYHVVVAVDTNDSIAANRIKMYVNGEQISSFATATYPDQGVGCLFSTASLGSMLLDGSPTRYLDGYVAEPHLVDGRALPASAFGMTDPMTGTWVPKYFNTIGPKGFYLDFADASSVSNLCLDRSGNSNNFTGNNVSVTAGVSYDAMVDVPGVATVKGGTDTGAVQRGNYCTLNPLQNSSLVTLQNGNLRALGNSGSNSGISLGSFKVTSGKWYWEVTQGTASSEIIGIASKEITGQSLTNSESGIIYTTGHGARYSGSVYGISGETYAGGGLNTGAGNAITAWTTGDVVGIAVDVDNGAMWMSKNGVWQLSGNPLSGSGKVGALAYWTPGPDRVITPWIGAFNTGYTDANFGQRPFSYTPPAGFKTLNTTNLPNPVIKRPSEHFDVKTWTGNGNSVTVGATARQTETIQITKSANLAASYQLGRKPATGGNTKTWTYSGWIKINKVNPGMLMSAGDSSNRTIFGFYADKQFTFLHYTGYAIQMQSNTQLTDTTKWHHIVLAVDTTKGSVGTGIKFWIDGVQQTSWGTATYTQNFDTYFNSASHRTRIGCNGDRSLYFDGSMAELNFVDGQQLDASNFGQFDPFNNWVPKRYTGTYGTNGFYLPFDQTISDDPYYVPVASFSNGQSQYLSVPANSAFNYGSGDFTLEAWILPNTNSATGCVFAHTNGGNYGPCNVYLDSGNLYLYSSSNGSSFDVASGASIGTPSTSIWNHVAVSRQGTSIRCFLNGVLKSTTTSSASLMSPTGAHWIGGRYLTAGSEYFNGFISNYRVVKGTALYTANFKPSSTPLTAVAGTSLLTCQNTALTDASSNAFTVTNNNGVTTANMLPFLGGANGSSYLGVFNGTSQVVKTTQGGIANFGTGDFCVECYVWLTNYPSEQVLTVVSTGTGYNTSDSSFPININIFPDLHINISGLLADTPTNVIDLQSPNHIAYTRSGTTGRLFVNGTLYATSNDTTNYTVNNGVMIGARTVNGSDYWGGSEFYVSNVRINKGNAVYTSNFIPSKTELTAITGTTFLTCQDPYFVDRSATNAALTVVNGAQMQWAQALRCLATGHDMSGNKNTFSGNVNTLTPQWYHVGSGLGSILSDSPTDIASNTTVDNVGGQVVGSYAKLNANDAHSTVGISGTSYSGNSANGARTARATLAMTTGKWYWEVMIANGSGANHSPGVATGTAALTTYVGGDANGWSYFGADGTKYTGGTSTSYGNSYKYGDTIGIAYDADTQKIFFSKNGTWQGSGNPVTGLNPAYVLNVPTGTPIYPAISTSSVTDISGAVNFGQARFMFNAPDGYRTLNTKNLRDLGAYTLPDNYGNYVNSPDLVWIKNRDNTYNHILQDTVRGPNVYADLTTSAQSSAYTAVQSFNQGGYTVGAISGANYLGNGIVGWSWNRSPQAGFDIVAYSGSGANRAISHSLGQAPKMVMVKNLNTAGENWNVWHAGLASTTYRMLLNTTAAVDTSSPTIWSSAGINPTSANFTVGTATGTNAAGSSYIAYLWSEVPGFSKFGTYTGNGSADGPFVHLGFRPRWIYIKRTDGITSSIVIDTTRSPTNPMLKWSNTDQAAADGTGSGDFIDYYSNGFKLRYNGANNTSGGTYIYAAFAEAPFKYANAR